MITVLFHVCRHSLLKNHFLFGDSLSRLRRFLSTADAIRPWKIIFYGTDKFSEVSLKSLCDNWLSSHECKIVEDIEVVCVEADSEVRRYANTLGLKIHTWPFEVPCDKFDIGIVVSFGHLIPTSSIFACQYGFINAHPSILPRWRGAAPMVHTILHGDSETGVTITQVSPKKFDVGNIILQEKCKVPTNCTTEDLSSELSHVASRMILQTLLNLPLSIKSSYPQSTEGVKYARKVKPENGLVEWEQTTAESFDRKFRAYKGVIKLYTFWKSLRIVLLEHISPDQVLEAKISTLCSENVSPGFCYFHKRRKILYVKCQDGWAGITRLKIPSTGDITAQEFYNGFISKVKSDNHYFRNSE